MLSSFLRFYSFIAQVVRLGDTDLEKLHLYGSWLKRILPTREAPQGEDVTDGMLDLEAYRLEQQGPAVDAGLDAGADAPLSPIDRFGANPYTEEESEALSAIIEAFNARHGTAFTDEDYLRFDAINDDIVGDEKWAEMLREAKSAKKREQKLRDAIKSGSDLSYAVASMKQRVAQENLDGLTFHVLDDVPHPCRFTKDLEVRVSYRWRRAIVEPWKSGDITFQHEFDQSRNLALNIPKRKPSAAKQEQDLQVRLSEAWGYLRDLS